MAPTSLPKHAPNHSKTTQKNIPKTHPKSTPNLKDFGFQMTSKMSTKIVHKSTWGALWATWDPYRPKKEVRPPGEPKQRSKAPLGHHSNHFWVLFSMCFNNIHYRISTMPNYLRINKHYALMPTLATPATTQTATNKKGAGGRGEAFRYIY